jgi:hypothetical protein
MFTSRLIRIAVLAIALATSVSFAGVFISVNFAPPALPVYAQPVCPGDGYLWVPGYWAYAPAGYYWVPGTWVLAPAPGLLWTPGYWGWGGGVYLWHPGYWGPHIGFYGGVNYGFGYTGVGYVGGMWVGGVFRYNTAVSNVNVTVVHNTYIDRTVIRNTVVNRTSFNGPGGITARPSPAELAAAHEQHIAPTSAQLSHERAAGTNRANFASVNHGTPASPAVRRPMTAYRPNTSQGNTSHAPAYRSNAAATHTTGSGSTAAVAHSNTSTGHAAPTQKPAQRNPPPKQHPAEQERR